MPFWFRFGQNGAAMCDAGMQIRLTVTPCARLEQVKSHTNRLTDNSNIPFLTHTRPGATKFSELRFIKIRVNCDS